MSLILPRLTMVRLAMTAVFSCLFTHHGFADEPKLQVTVTAQDISNRLYFDAVLGEINKAQDSIYVAMYSMYIRLGELDNPAYKLVEALIAAQNRGVAVKVYLDASEDNSKGNLPAYQMLQNANVAVYFIKPDIKMHAKTILIDNAVVIDGSANWTRTAVEANIEHNEILRPCSQISGKQTCANLPETATGTNSTYGLNRAGTNFGQVSLSGTEFASTTLEFFKGVDALKIDGVDINKKATPVVRISSRFLEDERFLPAMTKAAARYAISLYLKLLHEGKTGWVKVDYADMARYLGITRNDSNIRRALYNLKDDYGLLDYRMDKNGGLEVRLTEYGDTTKDYSVPQQDYFEVPDEFWRYGLNNELKNAQITAYFICLNEQACNKPKLYWWLGFKVMAEKYYMGEATLKRVFGVLEKMGLITVRRSHFAPGKGYDERDANEYCLLPLLSPKEKAAKRAMLEKRYGKDKVIVSCELAAILDKENDFTFLEGVAALVNKYGESVVRQGVLKMAQSSPNNPARNLAYLQATVEDIAKKQ